MFDSAHSRATAVNHSKVTQAKVVEGVYKKKLKMKRQDIFLIILARRPAELTAVGAACAVPSPVMKSIWCKLFQVTFNESLNICRRKDEA